MLPNNTRGNVLHKAKTEALLMSGIHKETADTIANSLCVKSFFDFSEGAKHEYPHNYRLEDKVDIKEFKHTTMRVTREDIQQHRREDNQWLRDSYGADLIKHDETCEACKPKIAA